MYPGGVMPTTFAIAIADSVDLYDGPENTPLLEKDKWKQRLMEFQQMSITCSFEDALITYHGEKLSKRQLSALKIIHTSTKPWLLGHITGMLMNMMNQDKIVQSAELLVSIIEKEGKMTEQEKSRLIINVLGDSAIGK